MKVPNVLLRAAATLLLLASLPAHSQIKDNGPATIVITYRSPPAERAAFRSFMERDGVVQFEQWKKEGVFRDYQVLFSAHTGERVGQFDMAVILQFASFVATESWKEIDRRMPGGLSPAGLALGAPHLTSLAYPIGQGEGAARNPAKATYVMGLYEVLVDAASYAKYATGYLEPQLKGWLAEGAITAYSIHQSHPYQAPAHAPWTALLVLEYADMRALADSEIVKERVRVRLAGDPAWKALSDDKAKYRKAKGFVFADPVILPAR